MSISETKYIVAELWPSGKRFIHGRLLALPAALDRVKELCQANREIRPEIAASTIEVFELKARYPVRSVKVDAANPGLPPAEADQEISSQSALRFPNL